MRSLPVLLAALAAGTVASAGSSRLASPERIVANANLHPAGTLRDGVLTLHLEARPGRWFPEADDGLGADVQAFGERGQPLQIPGPLVRVPAGTEVRATVRNAVDSALVLRGFHDRPDGASDSVVVLPGETRTLRFRLDAPGTYAYWARTTTRPKLIEQDGIDGLLAGAIVVDSAGVPATAAPRDRVLVVGSWLRARDATTRGGTWGEVLVINGKSWPHTERLAFDIGDTVRWRVVNVSPRPHPLHLHGFYFRVLSRGTWARDTVFAAPLRRLAVTEFMTPRTTMALDWVPTRPGNWVFHCHFTEHVSHDARLRAAEDDGVEHDAHRPHAMAGLVLGLHVREPQAPSGALAAASAAPPRELRLLVHERPAAAGAAPTMGYALQRDAAEPGADDATVPGPAIVLERDQPVRITVVNRMHAPTAVHWHGIELESFPDGVPGWSGSPGRLMPPIAPGDSFVAAFTPPRAGTFMYHAHMDEAQQIGSGLYAPLLVVARGRAIDPSTDHVLLFSQDGAGDFTTPMLVNGRVAPDTLRLRAGVAHRLRLISIRAAGGARLRLRSAEPGDSATLAWRPVAKDGADLPVPTTRPAAAVLAAGEILDVELSPPPGRYVLDVVYPPGLPTRRVKVPVVVR